ncbi:hypothetical protein K3495_g5423 [Podosphaera aphanis]|nr:hypothetical protein K3495_g5423 [Podosphaera aphanis]
MTGPLAIKNTPMSAAATALAHHILVYQLTTCSGAVALLDFTGRFSVAHLVGQCGKEALQHLHVFRIARNSGRVCEAVKQWMLYGNHASGKRVWVGTILMGGEGTGPWDGMGGVLVSVGWKGWLNVALDEVQEFDASTSLEQAWKSRQPTRSKCWRAWCLEGEYKWQ